MINGRPQPHPPPDSEPEPADERGLDFAWRTHTALTDWTARVDAKASIVLSFGGVLLGFFVTLTGNGRLLSHLSGWRLWTGRGGLAACAIGVVLAALVVIPQLDRRQAKKIWRDHYVYFGHLRHWKPADLVIALRAQTLDTQLEVLAKQLVKTSEIAWTKHSRLQISIGLLSVGVAAVTAATVWPS